MSPLTLFLLVHLRVRLDVLQSEVRGEIDDLQAWQGRTKGNILVTGKREQ